MSNSATTTELTTHDGKSLKQSLRAALRREKMRALLLIAPLLIFIMLSFVLPIVDMLARSVDNEIVPQTLPTTVVELAKWDSKATDLPDEAVYAAFYNDMTAAVKARIHTKLGTRLNYDQPGISSAFRKAGRGLKKLDADAPLKPQFIEMNDTWGERDTWLTMKRLSGAYTAGYYLTSVDAEASADGIIKKPEDERIYLMLFSRTIAMSIFITFMCVLLGYPIAYLLANVSTRTSNMLMIFVLLPFWTSLLVRTSAWKVLLQQQGVINDLLVYFGVVADENRLELINNMTGTVIAMTHILLPFMILPLFSVMKTIPPSYVRASKSMGATDWTTFWRIYFPNTVAGIGAGSILVFILAIGYYITPELVGGTKGVFISNRIAYHISSSLNWGLAAALGSILLVLVLGLYWVYDKIVGIDNVKLG